MCGATVPLQCWWGGAGLVLEHPGGVTLEESTESWFICTMVCQDEGSLSLFISRQAGASEAGLQPLSLEISAHSFDEIPATVPVF